jgi:hypothetical protein
MDGLDFQAHRILGITNPAEMRLVAEPEQVWQLDGDRPDVAVVALDETDARFNLAKVLGAEKLPDGAKLKRIK